MLSTDSNRHDFIGCFQMTKYKWVKVIQIRDPKAFGQSNNLFHMLVATDSGLQTEEDIDCHIDLDTVKIIKYKRDSNVKRKIRSPRSYEVNKKPRNFTYCFCNNAFSSYFLPCIRFISQLVCTRCVATVHQLQSIKRGCDC